MEPGTAVRLYAEFLDRPCLPHVDREWAIPDGRDAGCRLPPLVVFSLLPPTAIGNGRHLTGTMLAVAGPPQAEFSVYPVRPLSFRSLLLGKGRASTAHRRKFLNKLSLNKFWIDGASGLESFDLISAILVELGLDFNPPRKRNIVKYSLHKNSLRGCI